MKYMQYNNKLIIPTESNVITINNDVDFYEDILLKISDFNLENFLEYIKHQLPILLNNEDLIKNIREDNIIIHKNKLICNGRTIITEKVNDDSILNILNVLKGSKCKYSFSHIKNFIENINQNNILNKIDLARYLNNDDFEITEDGCLLAYKAINKDYTSIYDGKTKHEVGSVVEVKNYDSNSNNLCSNGLHFATKDYIKHIYNTDKKLIVIVKINPKDIVAIPKDYDNKKGRCRKYEVVEIFDIDKNLDKTKTQKISTEKKVTRIEQTKILMKQYDNDYKKVSTLMGISESTVRRNMYK